MSHVQELRAVVNAALAGDPVLARMHLQRAASELPDDPAVWLWMSWLADSPLVMARCLEMVLESASTEYHEVAEKGLAFARALADFSIRNRIPARAGSTGHSTTASAVRERQASHEAGIPEESDSRFEPLAEDTSSGRECFERECDESCGFTDSGYTAPDQARESHHSEARDTQTDHNPGGRGGSESLNDDDGLPESLHRAMAVTRSEFEEEAGCGWESIAAHPEAPVLPVAGLLLEAGHDHDEPSEADPALDDTVIEPRSAPDPLDDPQAELPEMDDWPESPRAAGWPSAPAIPTGSIWSAGEIPSAWTGPAARSEAAVPPPLPPEAAVEVTDWNRSTPVGADQHPQEHSGKHARWTAPEPSPNPALWRAAQNNWFESGQSAAQPGPAEPQTFLRGGTRAADSEQSSAGAWASSVTPDSSIGSERSGLEERTGNRLWESAITESPVVKPSNSVPPAIPHASPAPDILLLNGQPAFVADEDDSHGSAAVVVPARHPDSVTTASDAGFTGSVAPVSPIGAHTVLVVDDSPTVRKLVTMTLEKHGYQVVSAFDGVAAIKEIAAHNPSLILMDVNMPRLDGYQLCKLVKKHDSTKHIPVVMLSGKDGMFDRLRGRLVGCSGYISKPFVPEVLLQAVEQHISGSAL
jgi:twitching motility two-component system response regulator PilG